jgi:Nucleotidyl transferase AbiEii toxin, Type IV TA system
MSRPTRADAAGHAYLDLQNLARRQGRATQVLLVTYVLERFLARLAAGPDADRFVLKGGMLLAAWDARRATVDGDFLARGVTMDIAAILDRVVAIASAAGPVEDGVVFLTHTAAGTQGVKIGSALTSATSSRAQSAATSAGRSVRICSEASPANAETPSFRR